MFKPGLKVPRRCLDNHGWIESCKPHPANRIRSQVIHQAQVVLPFWPDVNIAAFQILETEPLDGFQEGIDVPGTWDHNGLSPGLGIRVEEPYVEDGAAHRRDLPRKGIGRSIRHGCPRPRHALRGECLYPVCRLTGVAVTGNRSRPQNRMGDKLVRT